MDFNYSPEDEAFRRELRSWLEANVPKHRDDDTADLGMMHDEGMDAPQIQKVLDDYGQWLWASGTPFKGGYDIAADAPFWTQRLQDSHGFTKPQAEHLVKGFQTWLERYAKGDA